MLRTKTDSNLVYINQRLNTTNVCEGRMNSDFNIVVIILGQQVRQLLDKLNCVEVIVIHLPIAANDWHSTI